MEDIVQIRKDKSTFTGFHIFTNENPDLPFTHIIKDEKHIELKVSEKGKYFKNYPSRPRYSYTIKTTCSILEGDYRVEKVGNTWYLDYVKK
jgi:hypothetical protein